MKPHLAIAGCPEHPTQSGLKDCGCLKCAEVMRRKAARHYGWLHAKGFDLSPWHDDPYFPATLRAAQILRVAHGRK